MVTIIKIAGWLTSLIPDPLMEGFCLISAWLWRMVMPKRFATAVYNIRLAYPDKPEAWCRRTAFVSFARTVEMAIFALVSPFWSDRKLLDRIRICPETWEFISDWHQNPKPKIWLMPHVCLVEAVAHTPLVVRDRQLNIGEISCIFRPLNQEKLDEWVRHSRERSGSKLLSKRKGFHEARSILKRNGGVGILFDQRAGGAGSLLMSMDRLTTVSELPAMLARGMDAHISLAVCERTGFLRTEIKVIPLETQEENEAGLIINIHKAWDDYLRNHPERASEWMWAHDRWRVRHQIEHRLHINHKRSLLKDQMESMGWDNLPRVPLIVVWMPVKFAEFLSALRVVRAMTLGRPEARFLLVGPAYGEWICRKSGLDLSFCLPDKLPAHAGSRPELVIILEDGQKPIDDCRKTNPWRIAGPDNHLCSSQYQFKIPTSSNKSDLSRYPDQHRFREFCCLAMELGLDSHLLTPQISSIPRTGQFAQTDNASISPAKIFIHLSDKSCRDECAEYFKSTYRAAGGKECRTPAVITLNFAGHDSPPPSALWPELIEELADGKNCLITDSLPWLWLGECLNTRFIAIQDRDNGHFPPDLPERRESAGAPPRPVIHWTPGNRQEFLKNMESQFAGL